ncbi:hypothetical protein J2X46_003948 [Nocardioides sp. BE266]|uniref:hypothetical protein n=1 Tax=Nocardioides sp. BE266 TaxID=2817725 RepID=UPI0028678A94|nr:hypothetical protein [Nocardioides sp. BE266]MDR7254946.1 hypothetical protein [Nocardioides sp. BE266]
MKRTVIAATALALAGTLAGCGGDDEPKADPSPTKSESPSATATTPEPTWDDKFSPAQLRRYEAARDRWLEFWEAYTDAARTGADTPGLLRMFEKYSLVPLSERSDFLDTYTRGGARLEVPPEVLWTNATKITAKTVTFNYCLDYTNARITNIDGRVTEHTPPLRRLVGVQMQKTSEGWKKAGYVNSGVKACTATAP